MAIIRLPPSAPSQTQSQIPLGLAASSGEGAVALGRAQQQAENMAFQTALQGIDALAQNAAAESEAQAKLAVSQGANQMEQYIAQRAIQSVDESGNPTYGTLISDVQEATDKIIMDTLQNIPNSKLRAEVELRLRTRQQNEVSRLYGVQQSQKYDFIKGSSAVAIEDLVNEAIKGEINTEAALNRIDQAMNATGGAYNFQEREKIIDNARQDIGLGRAGRVLETAVSTQEVNQYLETVDLDPYLSPAEKSRIKSQGLKVLKGLCEQENLTREF